MTRDLAAKPSAFRRALLVVPIIGATASIFAAGSNPSIDVRFYGHTQTLQPCTYQASTGLPEVGYTPEGTICAVVGAKPSEVAR